VERANVPGRPQTRFFAESANYNVMRRSLGLDVFNETLTASTLDDPRYDQVLERIHRWTYELRILPTAADISSFSSTGGTNYGPRLYQFKIGNLGLIGGGNYLMSALRQLGTMELGVVYPPAEEFPNAVFGAGMLAVYKGSPHKESAYEFLRFLASAKYNRSVAEIGDGIPANLKYARDPVFLDPPQYPNEAGCNIVFVESIEQIGVPYSYSPFVPFSISNRIDQDMYQAFMAGRTTARETSRRAAELINLEIQRMLKDRPKLREEYERRLERQKQIDQLRSEGKPVPLEWIDNPFHRAYYKFKGWVEP
jgi:multiple sugar transport system substrate-binding protein